MTKALTLYELNQMVHETITISMPDEYWVEAEISDIREVRGHCYMELIQKDEYGNTPLARASAKCWKNKWMYISPHFERITGHILRADMKILVQVYADFHETYGFSWIITDIDPTFTMGDMHENGRTSYEDYKKRVCSSCKKNYLYPFLHNA